MKKLVLAVLGLVVVLGAVILVGPSFVDWNSYKAEIARAVQDQTGRKLEIDGDIGFQVLPAPRLSVEQLRLANAEGGSADTFVSAGALEIHVALAPLLRGKIKVASVTLRDADVRLEQFADGGNNWSLGASSPQGTGAGSAGPADSGGNDLDLTLDGATIVNGTVSFRNHADGSVHTLSGIDATLSAGSLKGPFNATGRFIYRDLPLSLSAATGQIDAGQATVLETVLKVADDAAELSFGGTLVLGDAPRLSGTITATGEDLVSAGDALAPLGLAAGTLPAQMTGPFNLTAKVEAAAERVAVQDLTISAGGLSGEGTLTTELRETIAIEADLAVDRFSLDDLLARFEAPAGSTPQDSADGVARPTEELAAFTLPAGIDASLTLTADAVDFRGGVIRQPRVVAALADGIVVLEVLSAQMPGGSDLTVSGTLEPRDGQPQFAGRADFVSDNLRGALAWLGSDLDAIAPDRLRKGSLGADVTASPEQIQLTNWTMDLDTTQVRGGLTLLLRERPAFGLALSLGKLNLDAYLPPENTQDAAATGGDTSAGTSSPSALQQLAVVLNTFDANVRIGFEEITLRQTTILNGNVDATIQNGALEVRDLTVADLGGARVALSGSLAGSVTDPNTRLTFDIDAKSAARLARLAGLEPNETLQRLGAVKLKGSILGDLSNMTVDATTDAIGGTASVKGVVQPLGQPLALDLAVKLQHPDVNRLAATLSPGAIPETMRFGSIAVAATVVTTGSGAFGIDATMDLSGGKLGLDGTVDTGADVPSLALGASYAHPDVVALIRSFVPGYAPARRDLGPVALESRIEGTTETLAIKDLRLGAGPAALTGTAELTLGGPRPKLALAAETGAIEIDPWLPKEAVRPAGGVAPAVPVKSGSRAWSRETIDTSGLLAADADVTLTARQVRYGRYLLDNVDLAASLENGDLSVTRLSSGLFGGTLDGTARLTHGTTPAAAMTLKIAKADVRQAALSAADAAQVTGTLDYETNLQTSGRSEFALVSGLQGSGRIAVSNGTIEGFDLPAVSDQLKQLDRSVDFLVLAQKAMRGGTTPFDSLTASYGVTDGVLRSDDIALKSGSAEGRGTAVVNLPPQEMDVNSQFWLSEHPNSPPIGLRLVGPLNNPRQVLDANKMQAFVLQRIVERGILRQFNKNQTSGSEGTTTTTPEAAPTQPVDRLTPEKALEGVLRGLLGN